MVSHGTQGNVQETRIGQMEAEKYNYMLFKILAENTGQSFDDIYEISRTDQWFNSDEAKKYGLIDTIQVSDGNQSMKDLMKGFDAYYKKEVMKK